MGQTREGVGQTREGMGWAVLAVVLGFCGQFVQFNDRPSTSSEREPEACRFF